MEFPVEIVLAIVWVLIALLRRRQKASPALPPPDDAVAIETAPGPPHLDALQALLQRHLADFAPADETDAAARPSLDRPAPADPAPTAFEHDAHGFGADNPLSEEAFEKRPAFAPRPPTPRTTYDPHGLRARRAEPAPRASQDWAEHLATPASVRDAIVTATILERRGGRLASRRR